MTSNVGRSCKSKNTTSTQATTSPNCTYHLDDGDGYNFWSNHYPGSPALIIDEFVSDLYNKSRYLYISQFAVVRFANISDYDEVDISNDYGLDVRTCGLWYCVQSYDTIVENGIHTQRITGNWSATSGPWSQPNMTYYTFSDIPESFSVTPGINYTISQMAKIGTDTLRDSFNVYMSFGTHGGEYFQGSPATGAKTSASGTDVSRALFNVTDWDFWMDRLTLSLTTELRKNGESTDQSEHYTGNVFSTVAHVHVRWPWLAFPASMVVASIIFLLAGIWKTHSHSARPWKSDTLALLMCSVDEDVKKAAHSGSKVQDQYVSLKYDDHEGAFVRESWNEK